MSAAGYGGAVGSVVGGVSSVLTLKSQNKAVINSIKQEGDLLASHMRQININRDQLDRELGDILSENALLTAKNMSTAKVMMSVSGTVGGTSAQVSKQAYMKQIQDDANVINQARNQEISMLTDAVSKRMNYRVQSDATRSQIKSPLEATLGTLTSMLGGAAQGASLGQAMSGAMTAKTPTLPTMTGIRQGAYTPN